MGCVLPGVVPLVDRCHGMWEARAGSRAGDSLFGPGFGVWARCLARGSHPL